jgi:diguanylate cyclase (GGDEF)-like protein/PAS domain S-box-containing protein
MSRGRAVANRQKELSRSEGAFLAINSVSDGIITVDNQSVVTFLNKAAETLTGWKHDDAIHKPSDEVFVVVNGVTREADWHPLRAAMEDDERYSLLPNSILIRKDGSEIAVEDSISPIHDESGSVVGAAIIFRDVSLSRLMLMKALYRSNHDPLTTLPNRSLLLDRVQQALLSIQHRQHMIAILYIDVDGFKAVNDAGGHACGDLVLQNISKRMAQCTRASDTLCRVGGDEFILLLTDVGGLTNANRIADKLLEAMRPPFQVGAKAYSVTLSIGIAICDAPFMDSSNLIENADAAMYRAKQSGGNRTLTFDGSMSLQHRKRVSVEDELCRALENKEFVLYYQPQLDLRTRKIVGVEALLRWKTTDVDLRSPLDFIPVAERSGLIIPLGQWVLKEALKQQKQWRVAGYPACLMSVNVSSIEIQDKDYIKNLDIILNEGEYVRGSLMFELTETVLLQAERETEVLSILPQRGILLAIDDFGVGYSNLIYLRRFAVDCIKIDRYFIEHAATREQDAVLVKAIMGLGRSLDKVVIAEGVETEEQLAFLEAIGCDQVQGYFIGRPVAAEALTNALSLGKPIEEVDSK